MAMKLDISKAYDCLDWGVSERYPEAMGFPPYWTNLLMRCVSIVSYSFINGYPRDYLHPARGLQQNNLLSPYLFLMCAEGLLALLTKFDNDAKILGIPICLGTSSINHLMFVNDCLPFAKADINNCLHIAKVLKNYEEASGQYVNLMKSAICFSRNIKHVDQDGLNCLLGLDRVDIHEKYLGLPILVGRNKQACFSHIKERHWKQL